MLGQMDVSDQRIPAVWPSIGVTIEAKKWARRTLQIAALPRCNLCLRGSSPT